MDPTKQNPTGHETTDAKVAPAAMLVALTLGSTIVVLFAMYFLFGAILEREASRDVPPSPMAAERPPITGPRLQIAPPMDMKKMDAAEQEVLDSYGWVDRDGGIIRLPVERAMDLLAERGLPARDNSAGGQEQ